VSQENVEIVRRTLELGRRGADPGAAFDLCVSEGLIAPNVAWGWPRRTMLPAHHDSVGREGWVEIMRIWNEDFDELALEPDQISEVDNDRVVVLMHAFGTGKGSRVRVELRYGTVYTLEARRIVRVDVFPEPEQALEAVGLRG
jgi:ketosteroid isomerase-like protein